MSPTLLWAANKCLVILASCVILYSMLLLTDSKLAFVTVSETDIPKKKKK